MRLIAFFFWSISFVVGLGGCASHQAPRVLDQSVSAHEAKDLTVIFEGCGKEPTDGFLFCRLPVGSRALDSIRMYFPRVNCDRVSCIRYQLLTATGGLGPSGTVDKQETVVEIPASEFLGVSSPLEAKDGGERQVLVRLWYTDKEGQERSMFAHGVVYFWIVDSGYQTLACKDPEAGWEIGFSETCHAYFSTGFRTSVCCEGQEP